MVHYRNYSIIIIIYSSVKVTESVYCHRLKLLNPILTLPHPETYVCLSICCQITILQAIAHRIEVFRGLGCLAVKSSNAFMDVFTPTSSFAVNALNEPEHDVKLHTLMVRLSMAFSFYGLIATLLYASCL